MSRCDLIMEVPTKTLCLLFALQVP